MARSIREQIARLLMVGFSGPDLPEESAAFLRESPPGGVLLFKQNVRSQEDLRRTLDQIQEIAARPGEPPLLVGIDQEGGRVVRLGEEVGFPSFPSARAMAESPEAIAAISRAATVTADGLRALGININFAPVLDVVTDPNNRVIGDRSYGAVPKIVTAAGLAVIQAFQERGVAATAKHFPGHGPTAVDSHLDLPVIGCSREEMEAIHLPPFRAAVSAGVAAIMTAHAVYRAWDSDLPATLSRPILTGLLREEWGYDGVTTTDSMTMQAIARRFSVPEACVMAIEAGCDIVMVPSSPTLHRDCLSALENAIENGRIARDRIHSSERRLHALRSRFA